MKRMVLWLFTWLMFASCERFMFHPNEVRPNRTSLNQHNIERIAKIKAEPSFKFILTGDTQRFYEQLDAFVAHVNTLDDISFVLLNGDLVEFGLNNEYNWVVAQLEQLKVPYIASMGNHDMLGNGREIFHEMFGPENFSFGYGNNKFICINTNSRETAFDGKVPDTAWLKTELTSDSGYSNLFILSHVPPFSGDFDPALERAFTSLLATQPKTRISLHGHEHRFRILQPYPDGITYLVAGAAIHRNYALVEVSGEHFTITEKYY